MIQLKVFERVVLALQTKNNIRLFFKIICGIRLTFNNFFSTIVPCKRGIKHEKEEQF